jgi:hypothetical protein
LSPSCKLSQHPLHLRQSMERNKITQPYHYLGGDLETWDAIIGMGLGYLEGNIVKYVARYKLKGKPLEDLLKARAYLDKLIDQLEEGKRGTDTND